MSFDEVRFPLDIAHGASGGPERRTDIVSLSSGYEERNGVWANSRRSWDVGYGVKTLDQLSRVTAFFEARNAQLYGFRFRDPMDHKSSEPLQAITPIDQPIGTGTGSSASYQLVKVYRGGAGRSWTREIKKPVQGTVRIAVAGVETTSFTVNTVTGVVTLSATNGAAVTAGFEYDTPARFNMDKLDISLEAFKGGSIPQIPIIELRARADGSA